MAAQGNVRRLGIIKKIHFRISADHMNALLEVDQEEIGSKIFERTQIEGSWNTG